MPLLKIIVELMVNINLFLKFAIFFHFKVFGEPHYYNYKCLVLHLFYKFSNLIFAMLLVELLLFFTLN
jgi:hypothetical protein